MPRWWRVNTRECEHVLVDVWNWLNEIYIRGDGGGRRACAKDVRTRHTWAAGGETCTTMIAEHQTREISEAGLDLCLHLARCTLRHYLRRCNLNTRGWAEATFFLSFSTFTRHLTQGSRISSSSVLAVCILHNHCHVVPLHAILGCSRHDRPRRYSLRRQLNHHHCHATPTYSPPDQETHGQSLNSDSRRQHGQGILVSEEEARGINCADRGLSLLRSNYTIAAVLHGSG